MTSKQLSPGKIIRVAVNGVERNMEVVGILDGDGRVSLKYPRHSGQVNRRGCWWLPIEYVKEHGTLLESPTRQPTPRRVTSNQPSVTVSDISRVMSELGRRGGKIGGKRRAESLTPERRTEIALKAARKRWGS